MPSKQELNRANQNLASEAVYWKARYQQQLEKNAILHRRLARYRNGFWRHVWLRAKAILRGKRKDKA